MLVSTTPARLPACSALLQHVQPAASRHTAAAASLNPSTHAGASQAAACLPPAAGPPPTRSDRRQPAGYEKSWGVGGAAAAAAGGGGSVNLKRRRSSKHTTCSTCTAWIATRGTPAYSAETCKHLHSAAHGNALHPRPTCLAQAASKALNPEVYTHLGSPRLCLVRRGTCPA